MEPETSQALRAELAALHDQLRRLRERRDRERALLDLRIHGLATYAERETQRNDRLTAQLRSLEQELERTVTALAMVSSDLERIAASRAWRFGHGAARALDRMLRRHRTTEGAVVKAIARVQALERNLRAAELEATPETNSTPADLDAAVPELDGMAKDALAEAIRSRLGPVPSRGEWPGVSIVVLNRNGRAHMERLIAGLRDRTDYPRFELVVVDNGSSDGSAEFLRSLRLPFKLRLVANRGNTTFSEGNRQGAERAREELLLFLNNDVEPFEPGWLREMVALATRPGVGAVGATLLHAGALREGTRAVQHRGIRIRRDGDRLKPYNLDDGGALFGERFGVDVDAPATTGAAIMIGKERFVSLGGFPDGYRYGTEDVDLGLQIVARGASVLTSGRAHLVHRESSTQDVAGRDFKRENRLGNQRQFAERWGSRLRREHRLGRLSGDGYWAEDEPPHIAITLTSLEPGDGYGDWYTGHELGDAFEQLGWRVSYVQGKRDEWYALPDDLDYLLVLLDAYDLRRIDTDALRIAWVRNWTERWLEREWFGGYDLVFTTSRRSAGLIAARTGLEAELLPLATNPARFRRSPSEMELTADLAFTGNYWDRPREIQSLRPVNGEVFKIFGSNWEAVPELAPYVAGPVPYERLPAVYSSTKLVLDDAAESTLPYGSVNSRVFDALACGTVVISRCEDGVRELFDSDFPTWRDPATLRGRIDTLLRDEQRRDELGRRYQRMVCQQHTYAHRARQVASSIERAEERLWFCIKTGAPTRDVAHEWGDVHFGEALARELRRRGHRALVQVLDEWEALDALQYDVVVHLKGLTRYTPKPGQFNVLWCISHPAELTVEECEAYDLVCVASARFAEELRGRVRVPVAILEQATDPGLFYPEPDPAYAHELAFVANSRKVMRRTMADLLPTEHDLAVWGTNWEGLIDERYIAGQHVPNSELRKVYSTASIVLNDHWDDMREYGFVSNRIYDALACGALVLSDQLPELGEHFGEAVVTYEDAHELQQLIERLLASPEERVSRGQLGRQLVLERHTFAHRVAPLLELVHEHAGVTRRIVGAAAGGR